MAALGADPVFGLPVWQTVTQAKPDCAAEAYLKAAPSRSVSEWRRKTVGIQVVGPTQATVVRSPVTALEAATGTRSRKSTRAALAHATEAELNGLVLRAPEDGKN